MTQKPTGPQGAPAAVTCRQCGAQGLEDGTDPCPGLCPRCMDAALSRLMLPLVVRMNRPKATPEGGLRWLQRQMQAVGFTETAIQRTSEAVRRSLELVP